MNPSRPDASRSESSTPVSPIAAVTSQGPERGENVRAVVNAVLHAGARPCETGCNHVIVGRWTALGIANVIARADLDDWRS